MRQIWSGITERNMLGGHTQDYDHQVPETKKTRGGFGVMA
jgi:hypothetical protein